MDQLRLDKLVDDIEVAFGPGVPFVEGRLSDADKAALSRVFGDNGFQAYLQDQINRQIIRDYLTNAVLLGFVSEQRMATYKDIASSVEGRSLLSLHMLMSSIEQADELALEVSESRLNNLQPETGSPPHMELVRG